MKSRKKVDVELEDKKIIKSNIPVNQEEDPKCICGDLDCLYDIEKEEKKAHKDTVKYYSKVLQSLTMARPALDYQVKNISKQIEVANTCLANGYTEPDKMNDGIKYKTERIENIKRIMEQGDKLIEELKAYGFEIHTKEG